MVDEAKIHEELAKVYEKRNEWFSIPSADIEEVISRVTKEKR